MNSIVTFGYGNRKDHDVFIEYLRKFNITYVIDVRSSPRAWSRKWYGDAIAKVCRTENVHYFSKLALGNTSGKDNWIPPEKAAAEKALYEVSELLNVGNILLLCAELDSSKCHRVGVAEQLQVMTNASVQHLK